MFIFEIVTFFFAYCFTNELNFSVLERIDKIYEAFFHVTIRLSVVTKLVRVLT